MILVLCEEHDLAAFWAADRLRERGSMVEILTDTDLANVRCWDHRLGRTGVHLRLQLANGRHVCGDEGTSVLNRLSYLPSAWLRQIGGDDRDYAVQEMYAFYLSWLHCLRGPLVNPPAPQGLCGNWRHPSVWAALAGSAGLPTPLYRQSNTDDPDACWKLNQPAPATLFAVDDRVVDSSGLPESLHPACLRLARAAGCRLLGIDFDRDACGGWHFSRATVMPDLMRGGNPLIEALTEALTP